MNATNLLNTRAAAYGAAILVGGAVLYWVANKVLDKVSAGVQAGAVNPASTNNVAYRGVNAIGAELSGDPSWSLGSWLYDVFNPPYDPNAGSKYAPRKITVRKEAQVYDYLTDHG